MKECSKSIPRRLADPGFANRYFVGRGLDVGGRPDPLSLYAELFARITEVRTWDLEDGDGQRLAGVPDESFDFVHSSHCLEHLADPADALRNWLRVVKPGGHVVILVPDEDLYEQGMFPSTFNAGHVHTFTIHKPQSWSPASINVLGLLAGLGPAAQVVKIELLDATYRYGLPRYDQSRTPIAECGIEIVVRKRPNAEIEAGGRLPASRIEVPRETRLHLNQYRDDAARLRAANTEHPPFTNDDEL
ncbi:MAG: methyltransferase domain-containing protein [Burkholderiales bacterium]